jgi:hypothetical protein
MSGVMQAGGIILGFIDGVYDFQNRPRIVPNNDNNRDRGTIDLGRTARRYLRLAIIA